MNTESAHPKVARYLGLPQTEVVSLAEQSWMAMRESLAASNVLDTPIHLLAKEVGLKWPISRSLGHDTPETFLKLKEPQQILALRGFGRKKAHQVLSLLLSLDSTPPERRNGAAAAPAIITPQHPREGEYGQHVDRHWNALCVDLRGSIFASGDIESLALRWGLRWQSRSSGLSLRDIVSSPSWRRFRSATPGVGKKKMERLAAIVWRAWSEANPKGPAGSPPSTKDEARSIVGNLPQDVSLEGKIYAAFAAAKLKAPQQSILVRRYGLSRKQAMTLEEIGQVEHVTRERIRQVQAAALKKLTNNGIAAEILKQAYDHHGSDLLEELVGELGTRRITTDTPVHRAMRPEMLFLVEALFETTAKWIAHETTQGRIQQIPAGWWIGNLRVDAIEEKIAACRIALDAIVTPAPLDRLIRATGLPFETLRLVFDAMGLTVIGGYLFDSRPSVLEVRGLHALLVAHCEKKYLWAEDDLLSLARKQAAWTSNSRRGLVMDLLSLPGAAFDLPGRYVLINPAATKVFDVAATKIESLPSKTTATLDVESEGFSDDTLANKVVSLFDNERLLTFNQIEERYCQGRFGALPSLYPTLIGLSEITRYAPGYWGPSGLTLSAADIEMLSNEDALERYVRSRRSGGIVEDFSFWGPNMEYAWCRWAENHASRPLLSSLLSVADPHKWPTIDSIKKQWLDKQRRFSLYQLSVPRMSLERGYAKLKPLYALAHFAVMKGYVGTATIPHLLGLKEVDRRSVGTMALLSALGILETGPDLDRPWSVGARATEWLDRMSEIYVSQPSRADESWDEELRRELVAIRKRSNFGLFSGEDLCQAVAEWSQ